MSSVHVHGPLWTVVRGLEVGEALRDFCRSLGRRQLQAWGGWDGNAGGGPGGDTQLFVRVPGHEEHSTDSQVAAACSSQ